jgi:hypothetical protein
MQTCSEFNKNHAKNKLLLMGFLCGVYWFNLINRKTYIIGLVPPLYISMIYKGLNRSCFPQVFQFKNYQFNK